MYSLITRLLALSTLTLSVLAAPIVEERDVPPIVTITSVAFAGSGCRAGTVSGMLEPDLTSVTVLFSEYQASAGPNIPISENYKNCNLIIGFNYPVGWKYAVFSTEYRGFLSLEKDVTASQKSLYWFDGQPQTPYESKWSGPIPELDYNFTDDIERKRSWSPCGSKPKNLYINTSVRVNNSKNKKASGLITTDSITQRVTHVYGVRWARC